MTSGPTILVTGGCGYIGSHTITCLLNSPKNFSIVVVDSLCNSSPVSLDRVVEICKLSEDERKKRLVRHDVDLCDEAGLRKMFESSPKFDFCIHFAGLKSVGESSKVPLKYYENNIQGSLVLFRLMEEFDCRNIVFSSSATVYGAVDVMPITESATVGMGITNPYGRTKYMLELILTDFYNSVVNRPDAKPWGVTLLRYFNPVGNHPSGLIGEDPNGIPNNLMPYVSQVAVGRRDFLTVFGGDYDTPDGTGVRDYIHVVDLAEGHLAAVEYMAKKGGGLYTFNLGSGNGSSVLGMVKAMEKACGHEIKYKIGPRRPGDIGICYADPSYAEKELGWKATRGLDEMCRDLWSWQSKNPNGFATSDSS
uniref:UDP-glucose 4-epimerase n=1 Tax=Eucampia antarctica TaxID=49252 RepID=A0A7S2RD13_9STRA|mmetsp:Transcript_20549/g.19791  ORF Transcript_20549/g.19791 Transcript_20549/m.19791 type:complete len:365 (+) Transcript_20549:80-1174(+)|eukprot:CAMPEP_0197833388 /NCGR_PEP_ID=MMETSP1437-20131217/18871_1 /TAXON_ID=49252 ORGANISM="Eucampia antarctica, Strain CCMP1452" /NCGR_SAMPLE_ID=MMETSP1437 /ASSEMBLY_ACC=CAM_ASM_001096 /LENGTH=364 /DNA_ID=CAMNT_0043437415 /DNA_START=43 /DNA_END=1137 /DNA_ORIENTATION=+